jgi:hypothetical protein
MSQIGEALLRGKSGQTVKTPVLQHTINETFYESICLNPVHVRFFEDRRGLESIEINLVPK